MKPPNGKKNGLPVCLSGSLLIAFHIMLLNRCASYIKYTVFGLLFQMFISGILYNQLMNLYIIFSHIKIPDIESEV